MKRFDVIVSGTILAQCETREEAEQALELARHSFLAMVHPWDCFYIKEIEKKD